MKIVILKLICSLFLPKDIFIGKHCGPYTQKYNIFFGKIDNRGVLQGIDINKY